MFSFVKKMSVRIFLGINQSFVKIIVGKIFVTGKKIRHVFQTFDISSDKVYKKFLEKLLEKKIFAIKKTFATEELNFFAGINFGECYHTKYFAFPNFVEFTKNSLNRETCFAKVFHLDWIGLDWNALFRVDKIVEKKSN